MTQPDDSIGIGSSGLVAKAVPAAAQDTPSLPTAGAEPKPPTQHTLAFNTLYREGLDFADDQDFRDARRGLLASLPEPVVIKNSEGKPVWDLAQYSFVGVTERTTRPSPSTRACGAWPSST
jgi:alkyl sulfatase BDS1-like metallo-beta-lactamase superfamily hydrolase